MTSLSNQRCTRNQRLFLLTLVGLIALVARPVQGNDDTYYAAGDDGNANDNNYYSNYYSNNNNGGDDAYAGDDANANANTDDANNNNADGDDANNQYSNNDDANGDDANANTDNGDDANANDNNNGNGDDEYAQMNNQYYDSSNGNGNDASYGQYQDDWAENNANVVDDDLFHWENNVGFDGVSVMPVSCVNYNNGHMIKFEFFESETSYQCHFAQIGTFVVSIAHYMRAYFNHQALVHGQDFELPGDAGYLNCIMVQETEYSNEPLYAKIGCMERETFTSTKLALHLYTDDICSVPFDDGFTSRRHSAKGFEVNGHTVSSHVSFRPPFYTCQTCKPEEYSETFNKRAGTWYDDDYISEHGEANSEGDDQAEEEEENAQNDDNGDNGQYQDDYFADDAYLAANDDINYNNRMLLEFEEEATSKALVRVEQPAAHKLTPVEGQLEAFEKEFWDSVEERKRSLYDNAYDIDDWNMCQRVYTYGLWCDEDCRSLDAFRTDRWSGADIILLSIMATFLTAMMLLILAKRLKAAQKSRMYSQEDTAMPGLPPVAMMSIFLGIMTVIVIMAKFKFVNETLVFAVVTCLLLFIYMLKLTLFDNRRPVLLAATRHDVFDNPLDQRLFT